MEVNYFTILYWFCHTWTWICHRYTGVPHPETPSRIPPRTIPLGRLSASAPSIQYHALNLDCPFSRHQNFVWLPSLSNAQTILSPQKETLYSLTLDHQSLPPGPEVTFWTCGNSIHRHRNYFLTLYIKMENKNFASCVKDVT